MYQTYFHSLDAIVINDEHRVIVVSNHQIENPYDIQEKIEEYFNSQAHFVIDHINQNYFTYEFAFS